MTKFPWSPEILDALPEELAELFRGLELTLLEEIASRLKAAGQLNEVTVQDIRALRAHGIPLDEIEKAIRETTGISEQKLGELLDDVVERNQKYYSGLITLADVTRPETLVDAVVVDAIRRQTVDAFRNITRSMGFVVDAGRTMLPPAEAYQWALNSAELQIQSGAISYNQAIANATRQLADGGLCIATDSKGNLRRDFVQYESGHIDHIDVAVRRAVMTGVSQLNDQYTDQSAEYLNTRYFEISAHMGARNIPYPNPWSSHESWQGGIYYMSENGEPDPLGKYADLVETTGYTFVDGLCGANCRHRRNVFIPGVMEPTYSKAQLEDMKADKHVIEYEGRKYDRYQATQQQRKIERAVRRWKRRAAAATNDEDKQAAQIRVRRLNEKYEEFSKAAGLRMQKERMAVYVPK